MTIFDSALTHRVGLAHVFTGMGSELEKLKDLVVWPRKQKQQSYTKEPCRGLSLGQVSPTLIGNHSAASAKQTHLIEAEDHDRWLQVESGSPVHWHSCKGCAFLCGQHEPKCKVCGTRNPEHVENDCSGGRSRAGRGKAVDDGTSPASFSNPRQACVEVVIADGASLPREVASSEGPDSLVYSCIAAESKAQAPSGNDDSESSDDGSGDDEEDESGSEYDSIPGTLDIPPPVGTQVKVLYDDEHWHLAEVLATNGTKARICFESGKQTIVDVDTHAVRLVDYVSENEEEVAAEQEEEETWSDQEEEIAADDEEDAGQAHDADEDSEGGQEEEPIPGILQEAPPVGTLVKVFHEDERWHPARITASNGTKAIIADSDDEEDELDFEIHAVRLREYIEDEESYRGVAEKLSAAVEAPAKGAAQGIPNLDIAEEYVGEDKESNEGGAKNMFSVGEALEKCSNEEILRGDAPEDLAHVAENSSEEESDAEEMHKAPCETVLGRKTTT